MFRYFLIASSVLVGQFALADAEQPEFEIWPGELPAGSFEFDAATRATLESQTDGERIAFVKRPTLTVFRADRETANGCGVIVCPGGGYNKLAWQKEGVEVAEWFNSIGVTAFVLKYRIPRRTDAIHREPMQDVQRAVRLVRQQADNWQIDSDRLGVLGFSAGGHLTVMSGVQFETRCYEPVDEADRLSARPDFICPIYCAYLGDNYNDRTEMNLSDLVTVSKSTPPTFLAVTADDAWRGAQSALLLTKLIENDVPAELHVYAKGGHGYGMRPSANPVSQWPQLLEDWLETMGFLDGDGVE